MYASSRCDGVIELHGVPTGTGNTAAAAAAAAAASRRRHREMIEDVWMSLETKYR